MSFSMLVLRSFVEGAERLNLSRDDLLAGLIADSALESEHSWIDNAQFYEILSRGVSISQDPAFGLRIGEQERFTAFGAAGMLFSVVRTFREAMAAMAKFHDVARDEQDVFVDDEERSVVISYRLFDAAGVARRCLAEIVLSSLSALLRQYGGARGLASSVQLDYPAPDYAAEYSRVFGCPVAFDQPRVAFIVDRELADKRQLLSHPELAHELRQQAETRQTSAGHPRTLVGRVRFHLREGWRTGAPTMDAIARSLGMSQRSLHRHLARQGVDYRSILNEARCEAAAQLLRHQHLSVKQVAQELGFSNSSAFYRAFKRWLGCSPSDYARGRSSLDSPTSEH